MIYVGLIYKYDNEQGTGLIMIGEGERKEFNIHEWVDTENSPAVGQKIAYTSDGFRAQIRVATPEDIALSKEQPKTAISSQEEPVKPKIFDDLESCLYHFTSSGFKLVKDVSNDGVRTLALRSFVNGDPLEVIVKQTDSKVEASLTVNGKLTPIL